MLTNKHFARYAAVIARKASSWSHDTMSMGDHHWNGPPINDSVERFCKEIEEVLGWIRAEAEQT